MSRNIVLLIFFVIIAFVIIFGMMYFFERGETTIENEEWEEFLWTVDDLQTFLIIIILVSIVSGFIILRWFRQ